MQFNKLLIEKVVCRSANNAAEVWSANNEALRYGKFNQDPIAYWLMDKIALGDKLHPQWDVRVVRGKSGIGDDATISLDTAKVKAFLTQAIADGYLSLEGREELNKRSPRKESISIITKKWW
jgi:hypothetical protein